MLDQRDGVVISQRRRNRNPPLPSVDGRRATTKRFNALVADFSRDLGGVDGLTSAEAALIRQAAATTILAEGIQLKLLNGEPVEMNDLVRSTNAVTRILMGLGVSRRSRGAAHVPLRERLGGA
jgi:hypothetical protein